MAGFFIPTLKKKQPESLFIRYVFAGNVAADWILPIQGKSVEGVLGGSLPYAAAGLKVWDSDLGLISKISRDFPQELENQVKAQGVDTTGIARSDDDFEYRRFFAYCANDQPLEQSPISVYSDLNLNFPKKLLGFSMPRTQVDERKILPLDSIRNSEIPIRYFEASSLLCCKSSYLNHLTISTILQQGSITTFALDSCSSYMVPAFINDLNILLKGITIFFTSEKQLQALFFNKTNDIWEMADELIGFGAEIVVVKRGSQGQLLRASSPSARWQIPAYPARVADPTGCGDSYCGGFMAGYHKTYDPLESCLYGNISASLCLECSTPGQICEYLPGLPEIRKSRLVEWIKKV